MTTWEELYSSPILEAPEELAVNPEAETVEELDDEVLQAIAEACIGRPHLNW